MPFPTTLDAMFSSGYKYARWEHCATCGELVEVYTTPGGRTLAMEPMCPLESPAIKHWDVCKPKEAQDGLEAGTGNSERPLGENDVQDAQGRDGDGGASTCVYGREDGGSLRDDSESIIQYGGRDAESAEIKLYGVTDPNHQNQNGVDMAFPKTLNEMNAAGYKFDNQAICRGCGDDLEWWITPNGMKIPMNPMERGTAKAVAHWATCTERNSFRKRD